MNKLYKTTQFELNIFKETLFVLLRTKHQSQSLLDIAKRGVELAIEENEQSAEKWIKRELDKLDVETVLFNELMPLNIQARYPEDKELLLKALTGKKCRELYTKTKEFYTWIKKLLK